MANLKADYTPANPPIWTSRTSTYSRESCPWCRVWIIAGETAVTTCAKLSVVRRRGKAKFCENEKLSIGEGDRHNVATPLIMARVSLTWDTSPTIRCLGSPISLYLTSPILPASRPDFSDPFEPFASDIYPSCTRYSPFPLFQRVDEIQAQSKRESREHYQVSRRATSKSTSSTRVQSLSSSWSSMHWIRLVGSINHSEEGLCTNLEFIARGCRKS